MYGIAKLQTVVLSHAAHLQVRTSSCPSQRALCAPPLHPVTPHHTQVTCPAPSLSLTLPTWCDVPGKGVPCLERALPTYLSLSWPPQAYQTYCHSPLLQVCSVCRQ